VENRNAAQRDLGSESSKFKIYTNIFSHSNAADKWMDSLEILQALSQASSQCQICGRLSDRRPRVWTRSTAIIANTADHDHLANIGSLSTSMNTEQEHISVATDYRPWTPDSSYVFDGTLPRIVEVLRKCKECFLKLADNTVIWMRTKSQHNHEMMKSIIFYMWLWIKFCF